MRVLLILALAVASVLVIFLTSQPLTTSSAQIELPEVTQQNALPSATPASPSALAATTNSQTSEVKEIHIKLGNFFFEGPEGRSGSESKSPTTIEPKVVLRLKNGEPVKLIFENTSNIVDHEVISPLFSAPEEKRFAVPPLGKVEIELTPNFLTAEDGGTLTFHLVCHVRHGQTTDHYKLGMHGLIEIVPND